MAHEVFISHSTHGHDKPIADAVCAELERQRIRCWIAPRDVRPGHSFGGEIVEAIEDSLVFVIVFSNQSNKSPQVLREVERAVHKGIPIIPFRIEDFTPSKDMEYFLSSTHWLDALTPPLEKHLQKLADIVRVILEKGAEEAEEPSPPGEALLRAGKAAVRPGWFWAGTALITLWLAWLIVLLTLITLDDRWYLQLLFSLLLVLPLLIPGIYCLRRGMAVDLAAGRAEQIVSNWWWAFPVALGFVGGMICWAKHRYSSRFKATNMLTLGIVFTIIWTIPLSISHPAAPGRSFSVVGSFPTSWEAQDVFVSGDKAYLANGKGGLIILDVSEPSDPKEIGQCPLDNAMSVIVIDDVAYVCEQGEVVGNQALSDRLVLIDVSDPSDPQKLGEYEPEGMYWNSVLYNFAVEDQTVFLTASDRMASVDVSMPSEPEMLGEFLFDSNIVSPGIAITDGVAYLMANRLHVVDVEDPSQPVEIGGLETGWGSGIDIVEDTAYAAVWDDGLYTIDISSPSRAVVLGEYKELVGEAEEQSPGTSYRQVMIEVSVSDNIAYVTYTYGIDHGTWMEDLENGVMSIDVSDPRNPKGLGVYSEAQEVTSVFAVGDLVYITEKTGGLCILTLD
jgi:hypothetical protein